jgi:phage terminase small subunit
MAYIQPGQEPPLKGKGSKLSPKMALFVEEYMVDLNASEAVLRAGYKTRNQNRMGAELLRHPLVAAEVSKRKEARSDRLELTADYVLTKLVDIVEKSNDNPTAALRGLELLGKHLGLYRDRQEISGPDGGAIEMEQKAEKNAADFTSQLSRLARRSGEGEVVKFPIPTGKSKA